MLYFLGGLGLVISSYIAREYMFKDDVGTAEVWLLSILMGGAIFMVVCLVAAFLYSVMLDFTYQVLIGVGGAGVGALAIAGIKNRYKLLGKSDKKELKAKEDYDDGF